MTNILIADDHEIFIDALASMLRDSGEIRVVATARNGLEVLEALADHDDIELLVLDVSMPGMDGVETVLEVRRRGYSVPTLMLTQEESGGTVTRAVKAGAAGYVLKTAGREELLVAIRTVAQGGEYITERARAALIARLAKHAPSTERPGLTRREVEVLQLIASGLTTHEMADRLFISAYTVETHRRNLLQKLCLKNAAALTRYAVEQGLTDA